jgi:hypothetical protein
MLGEYQLDYLVYYDISKWPEGPLHVTQLTLVHSSRHISCILMDYSQIKVTEQVRHVRFQKNL